MFFFWSLFCLSKNDRLKILDFKNKYGVTVWIFISLRMLTLVNKVSNFYQLTFDIKCLIASMQICLLLFSDGNFSTANTFIGLLYPYFNL